MARRAIPTWMRRRRQRSFFQQQPTIHAPNDMITPRLLNPRAAGLCLALLGAAHSAALAATGTITNATSSATIWRDTAGNEIINNCGNVMQVGSTFYWYGWDKYAHTVNVYTSTTLGSNSWTEHTGTGFPMFGSGFHGRPDVIKHPTNGTYVMIVEFSSGPGRNGIEYLTSTSPTGPFTSVLKEDFVMDGSGNLTITMGDKGIYQDDDANKTAYLLCTSDDGGNTNGTTKIIRLNSNYIGQAQVLQSWTVTTNRKEALAMFKRNGTYYLTASGTHGWNSGQSHYRTASSLTGTFSAWQVIPTNPTSSDSYNTQHDFILKIVGSSVTSFIYLGDRWSQDTGVGYGRNAWFPLTFDASGVPTIKGDTTWTINPATGVINGTPQTINVSPAKDAMVKAAAASTNFGTSNQLQVSAQSGFQKEAFLQFNVSGIPSGATITGATLLVASQTTGSGRTINAKAVANTSWSETGITWNNRPSMGATLSSDSSHTAGVDSTWNVTSHITGNGNFTIGLQSAYSGDTNFHSREATDANNRPLLQITYQP